jgi:diacylglycerol kinase (ATP)
MRIKLVANPGSGRYCGGETLRLAKECLSRAGNEVDVETTPQPGSGTAATRRAVEEGYEMVVACGGDGTLREVVCGLVGSGVSMGIIPLGTGNVIAMDLGIPRDPREACLTILEGAARQIDIGRCGRNHFVLAAGVGFDGEVIAETDLELKSKIRNFAYIYAGLKHVFRFKPKEYLVEADTFSGKVNALAIAICNSRRYGGYRLKHDISLTDVCVIQGQPLPDVPKVFFSVVYRQGVPRRNLLTFKARHLRITSREGGIVHNDGDVVGELPVDFEVVEKGLSVIVPRS